MSMQKELHMAGFISMKSAECMALALCLSSSPSRLVITPHFMQPHTMTTASVATCYLHPIFSSVLAT